MTIIVTGAGGMLGQAVVRAAQAADVPEVFAFTHADLDVTDPTSLFNATLKLPRPLTVINCAGIVRGRDDVPQATRWLVNAEAPRILARRYERVVQVSTDCVFSGEPGAGPYPEDALTTPTDWYGRSKAHGEFTAKPHVTVRGSFIGFEGGLLRWFLDQPPNAVVDGYDDHVWNGGFVDDYAACLLDIALGPLTGVVHLVGEWVTKGELLHNLAHHLRPDITVRFILGPDGPRHMVLKSTRKAVPMLANKEAMLRAISEAAQAVGVRTCGT